MHNKSKPRVESLFIYLFFYWRLLLFHATHVSFDEVISS